MNPPRSLAKLYVDRITSVRLEVYADRPISTELGKSFQNEIFKTASSGGSIHISLATVRYGLVVRIAGSHPAGPGSIPGNGILFFLFARLVFVTCLDKHPHLARKGPE